MWFKLFVSVFIHTVELFTDRISSGVAVEEEESEGSFGNIGQSSQRPFYMQEVFAPRENLKF